MGLSHHWQRPTELPAEAFRLAVGDCRVITAEEAPELAGFDGTGEARFDDGHIVFNGRAPRACEPFEIAVTEFDRRGRPEVFGHCKTQGMPYDLWVKAVLIVLQHHLTPWLDVTSDEKDDDWSEARTLVQQHLGYGEAFKLSAP